MSFAHYGSIWRFFFSAVKKSKIAAIKNVIDIFNIFAQNSDYVYMYMLEPPLTSTHNLCFGRKIRKIGIPVQTLFFYIKLGFKGVYITWTCFLSLGHKKLIWFVRSQPVVTQATFS